LRTGLAEIRRRYGFAWDSLLLMAAGGAAGLILFVYHAVMKRMLGADDYASLVALLGLLNFMVLPAESINYTMSRFVAEHVNDKAVSAWVTIFRRALGKMTRLSLIGLAAWVLCAPWLAPFFGSPSVAAVAVLGLAAVLVLYMPIITGTLQGAQMFGHLAGISLLSPLSKLALCAAAVWLGAGLAGIIGAIAASILATGAIASIPFHGVVARTEMIEDYDTRPIYRYFLPVLLSQGALLLLMNADLIFFKRFLYGEYAAQAPAYAQAATLSRAVVFISQPLAIAMFPRAVNSSRRAVFFGPLLFAGLAGAALALLITLYPEVPFGLVYATDDPVCLAIGQRYVWAALPLSMAAIALKYVWARHLTSRALALLLPIAAGYLTLLYFHHRTAFEMINCLAAGSWTALAALVLLVLRSFGAREAAPE